jgi:hypothetical protein
MVGSVIRVSAMLLDLVPNTQIPNSWVDTVQSFRSWYTDFYFIYFFTFDSSVKWIHENTLSQRGIRQAVGSQFMALRNELVEFDKMKAIENS